MTDRPQEPVEATSTQTRAHSKRKPRSPEYKALLGLGALILALAGGFSTQLYGIRADLKASLARADAYQALVDADRQAFLARADANRQAFQARADANHRAFLARADANRRAFQAAMDEFHREISRLTDRQAPLEGMQEAQASDTTDVIAQ